jgi:hypothetical protein
LYKHLVNLFGGRPVYLDTYETGFGIDADRLEKLITPKTKLLLPNSPANPTGRIIPKSQLEAIAKVCAKHGIAVVSDEIYRAFSYEPMTSMAEVYPDTVVLVGHSKTFGMTGWHLGYACGSAEIIQAMTKVQQYSFVCAPSVVQYAALACPGVDSTENITAYRRKRDLMVGILSTTFELAPPDGAFYLWAKAPNGLTGDQFVDLAITNNMLNPHRSDCRMGWRRGDGERQAGKPGKRARLGSPIACDQAFSSLKACPHWLRRKPGMHHSMHRGSMARALSTEPISSVSQPNAVRMPRTSAFAWSLLPQMNMLGLPPRKDGFTIKAFPTQEKALTRKAPGARRCRRSISESFGPVKKVSTPLVGGISAMGLVASITTLPVSDAGGSEETSDSTAEPLTARMMISAAAAASAKVPADAVPAAPVNHGASFAGSRLPRTTA